MMQVMSTRRDVLICWVCRGLRSMGVEKRNRWDGWFVPVFLCEMSARGCLRSSRML